MTRELYEIIKKELYSMDWSQFAHSLDLLLKEQQMKHNLTEQDLLDFEGFETEDEMNENEIGTLKDYDCQLCKNRGYNYRHEIKNGKLIYFAKDCICKKLRAEFSRLEKCGINRRLIETYKFDKFNATTDWQKNLKSKAELFVREAKKDKRFCKWFAVSGQSGCGKSHICTAIYIELLKSGLNVKYMAWKDAIDSLKLWKKSSYADNQKKYEVEMQKLKTVDVLYIDDFLKLLPITGFERDQELDLAYAIINARYNNGLITIISTEEMLWSIRGIDFAIASRIEQLAKDYWIQITEATDKNQRARY